MSANFKGSRGAGARITIAGAPERSVDAPLGAPLLGALRTSGIFLPSQCGGVGSCGQCRVEFEQGGPLSTSSERAWLSSEERMRGVRLACQHRVEGDARIAIDPAVREARLFRARLAERSELDVDLGRIVLALMNPPSIEFRGGQYVQLLVPSEANPAAERVVPPDALETHLRAYSIASSPNRHDRFELVVRRVEHGAASSYLFARLSVGDELRLAGPFGEPAVAGTRLLLLAAGAGIAPARSIALEAVENGDERRVSLIYSARSTDPLAEEMERLADSHPRFRFIRAPAQEVEEAIGRELGEGTAYPGDATPARRAAPPGAEAAAIAGLGCHVSGPPSFVDRCVRALLQFGVRQEQIRFDRFG